jgi:hypothetical protein
MYESRIFSSEGNEHHLQHYWTFWRTAVFFKIPQAENNSNKIWAIRVVLDVIWSLGTFLRFQRTTVFFISSVDIMLKTIVRKKMSHPCSSGCTRIGPFAKNCVFRWNRRTQESANGSGKGRSSRVKVRLKFPPLAGDNVLITIFCEFGQFFIKREVVYLKIQIIFNNAKSHFFFSLSLSLSVTHPPKHNLSCLYYLLRTCATIWSLQVLHKPHMYH